LLIVLGCFEQGRLLLLLLWWASKGMPLFLLGRVFQLPAAGSSRHCAQ
jgi:hypothetical protein